MAGHILDYTAEEMHQARYKILYACKTHSLPWLTQPTTTGDILLTRAAANNLSTFPNQILVDYLMNIGINDLGGIGSVQQQRPVGRRVRINKKNARDHLLKQIKAQTLKEAGIAEKVGEIVYLDNDDEDAIENYINPNLKIFFASPSHEEAL